MAPRKPPRGVAASVVLYAKNAASLLLIKRKWEPDKGKWAFPGGMMETDRENLETTAVRELLEETGVKADVSELRLLDILSEPARDPRGHVVDVCYIIVREEIPETLSESDETITRWVPLKEAATLPFALGHERVYKNTLIKITELATKDPDAF